MNESQPVPGPESSAVRVALWRALHVQADPPPHVFQDELGLQLASPSGDWRSRPDMDLQATSRFRASIAARARFIEDLVKEQAAQGIAQYVILGAGLDTFAQREPDIAAKLRIFEVDKPSAQAWKQKRLRETGWNIPAWLRFIPVDFEAQESWWDLLIAGGFDVHKPAVLSSTGVTLYLTKEAITSTLRQVAELAPGSTLAMTYLLPLERVTPEERPGYEMSIKGARKAGTPFISFFESEEILGLAQEAGFKEARTVPASSLIKRYFADRTDDFRPGSAEELLVATT